jgi:hypothetical protein
VDLLRARQTVATSALAGEVAHDRMTPVPPLRPEEVVSPDMSAEAIADPVRSPQIGADSPSNTAVEQHGTAPAPPLKQRGASHQDPWPLPAQQAPVASISISGNGSQSRVTIGRIDVQVNNPPPNPPSAPPSSGTRPIAADILEGRFLSRFALKL